LPENADQYQPAGTEPLTLNPPIAARLSNSSAVVGMRQSWWPWAARSRTLLDLLEHEPEAGVRAVLGHWMFGYVHPYPDGNGRMARFLMNTMLASGGYPWTVVRVEDRKQYLAALDSASIDQQIGPFAEFLAQRIQWSVEQAHR
jgi:Fic/DOC family protein